MRTSLRALLGSANLSEDWYGGCVDLPLDVEDFTSFQSFQSR